MNVDELFTNLTTLNFFHNTSCPYNILKIANNPKWDKKKKNGNILFYMDQME